MKKTLLTIAIAITIQSSYAQFSTSGNPTTTMDKVGIGTASPSLNLHVDGATGFPAGSGTTQTGIMRLGVAGGYGSVLDFGSNGALGQGWIQSTDRSNLSLYYHLLLNPNGGNVGIGTTSPATKLDVAGGATFRVNANNYLTINYNGNPPGGNKPLLDYTIDNHSSTSYYPPAYFNAVGAVGISTNSYYCLGCGGDGFQIPSSSNAASWDLSMHSIPDGFGGTGADSFSIRHAAPTSGLPAFSTYFYINEGGNVGIGSNSPRAKLDVNGYIRQTNSTAGGAFGAIEMTNSRTSGYWTSMYALANDGSLNFETGNSDSNSNITNKNTRLSIQNTGNVGIGTTTPVYKLGLPNDATISFNQDAANPFGIEGGDHSQTRIIMGAASGSSSNIAFGVSNGGGYSSFTEKVRINSNGNVGIGTTIPDEKLTVKGHIHAEEVKVDLSVPGPDYVFEPDYKLTGLAELKTYLDKNHHLPEIPSAKEMEKEGISLGDMNIKLLKEVEELTLYLIEKDKQIAEQRKINQSLQSTLAKMNERLNALETK